MDLLLEVRQYSQLVRVPKLYETINLGDLFSNLKVFTNEYYSEASKQGDIQFAKDCNLYDKLPLINSTKVICTQSSSSDQIFTNKTKKYHFSWDPSKSLKVSDIHGVSYKDQIIPIFDHFIDYKLYLYKDFGWAEDSHSANTPKTVEEYENAETRWYYVAYYPDDSSIYQVSYCVRRELSIDKPVIRLISARKETDKNYLKFVTRFGAPFGKGRTLLER